MAVNIPGLLGKLAGLPEAITSGLLGPLPQSQGLGLDPSQMAQARQSALTDMAMGMVAGGNRPAGLMLARQNAMGNYRERLIDLMREQELARVKLERETRDAKEQSYLETLPEAARPLAEVAGVQSVAQMQLAQLFAPPEKEGEPPAAIKIARFLTDPTTPEDQKAIVRQQIEKDRQGPGPLDIERQARLRYPNDPQKREEYIAQRLDKLVEGPRVSAEEYVKQKVISGGVGSLSPGEKEIWDRINRNNVPWWMQSFSPAAAQPGGTVDFNSLKDN